MTVGVNWGRREVDVINFTEIQALMSHVRRDLEEVDTCSERIVEREGGRSSPGLHDISG